MSFYVKFYVVAKSKFARSWFKTGGIAFYIFNISEPQELAQPIAYGILISTMMEDKTWADNIVDKLL